MKLIKLTVANQLPEKSRFGKLRNEVAEIPVFREPAQESLLPLLLRYSSGMLRVLERRLIKSGSDTSRLSFEADLGPGRIGNRFLLLDGKRAYDLGNNCQTCATLFQRLPGANRSIEIAKTAETHTGDVYNVAWSPDGKRLATASEDKTAKVWDAASGQE